LLQHATKLNVSDGHKLIVRQADGKCQGKSNTTQHLLAFNQLHLGLTGISPTLLMQQALEGVLLFVTFVPFR
jgi:hypothetical protein